MTTQRGMKKLSLALLALLALTLAGCENDPRGQMQTEQQPKEDVDYKVTFLFEVDNVRVYRFYDGGQWVYFTNAQGNTEYIYTTKRHTGKTCTTETHHVQSVNNQVDSVKASQKKAAEIKTSAIN